MLGVRALLLKRSMEEIQTLNQRFTFIFTGALWALRSISYNAEFHANVKAKDQKGSWEATGKKRKFLSASSNFYKQDSMLSRSEIDDEHSFTQKHTGIGRLLVQLSCLSYLPLSLLRTDKCTGFHIQFNGHPVTHCTTAGATSCGKIVKR